MITNYYKIAWRNLRRHKGFSLLNIAGLALGFTACFLIGIFVWDEYQYDQDIPDGDRVYRVYNNYMNADVGEDRAAAPPTFTTTLQETFPEVEQTARILMLPESKTLFERGDKKIYEQRGIYVDSTFFEVLPLPFKWGSSENSLKEPASIVISEAMSKRYFGDDNPVGSEIVMDKAILIIRGVFIKDPKFHLQFDYTVPLALAEIPAKRMENWGWQQFYNYVKVKKGTDVAALEDKFRAVVDQKTREHEEDGQNHNNPVFQPLKEIHLHSANFKYDNAIRGNITYVRALSIIALFILIIACFNFINLATARSLQRAKEVGVRKTIGADRKHLIIQFIGETVFLTFISFIISFFVTLWLLPWLNEFTGKDISYSMFSDPLVYLVFFGLTLSVGVLAGLYPAIFLSGFKPVKVLKGAASADEEPGKIPLLRHSLVVIQFSLSVILIISAVVVFNQVSYLHTKDLGFRKDQIMFFPMRGEDMFSKTESFKEQLMQIQGVSSVSIGYGFPGDAVAGDGIKSIKDGRMTEQNATQLMVDYDYIKTLGLEVIAGRQFSKEVTSDKDHAFMINETAVKNLGFGTPENALGKKLFWNIWNDVNPDSLKEGEIIGVVKDFNYKSLYDQVETTILQIFPPAAWKVAVKVEASHIQHTIAEVSDVWNNFTPDYPIEYKFMDENFEQMYESEDKLKTLLGIFTGLAIFIGCLGLFGLAAFSAERRKREIGIRKVLGASVENIVMLLSKDFVKLVLIAVVIASPIAWYFMNEWLQEFAYKIEIGWWMFAFAGVTAVTIAILTVSFHSIKSAFKNPIKNLRTE